MNKSDGQRAIKLFEAALERERADRAAFLEQSCRGDPTLRAEVESLLAADERAAGFLEPPAQARPKPVSESDPLIGTAVGKYHIQSVIAAGGMGTVYEAVQQDPRRTVALKVIRAGMASRSTLRRFKHESEILGRLRHPGIAQIYEAGTHGGKHGAPFFAMEYVPGARAITRFAKELRLSTRQRLELFTQVCDAVHAGHQRGIIHRDLKPANILVDDAGRPKLIDFGVARATDTDMTIATLQTDVGKLVGTLRYMSPEQCDGVAADLDTRSDVYALGVVLFELLTGELPYDLGTASPFEMPRVIREREPQRMSAVNRALRGDIETIVLKALEKDRGRRYQSAAELTRDIEHFLRNEPIEAKRGSGWYVLGKTLRRHRIKATVAAAFMVVVIGSAASLALLYHQSERQRAVAEQRAEELRRAVYHNSIALAQTAYEAGDGVELTRRLSACPKDLRGWEWSYLQRLSDTSLATLRGHDDTLNGLALSPDGRLITSGSNDGVIRLWDATSHELLRTLRLDGFAEQISFSPDNRLIVCGGRGNHEARVWDVATGDLQDTCSIRSGFAVAFSPDGTSVAAGGYEREPLRVWNAATGQLRQEWPGTGRTRPMNIAWSPDSRTIATARADGTLVLLDTASGRTVREFTGHTADIRRVAFSPDGRQVASSSYDNTLRIWDVESGEPLRVLGEKGEIVVDVAFSPDGKRVAAGGASALRVWDLASGEPEALRLGHAELVSAVTFSPDGERILTASHDQTVKIWDARPLVEPRVLAVSSHPLTSVAVSADGRRLSIGDEAGRLRILEMPSGNELSSVAAHGAFVWALAYCRADGRLASGGSDGKLHIWEDGAASPLMTMQAPETSVWCVAWTPDGRRLASGHADGGVRIWDAAAGRELRTINAHQGPVRTVSFFRDGTCLVTAGDDAGPRIWSAQSGAGMDELPTGAERNVAAISLSERLVAAGADDKSVCVWDLLTGEPRWKVTGHLGPVVDLAFLPGEHRLITCGYKHLVRIWDVDTGEATLTLRGHDGPIRDMAISPDGRWFVTASVDKTVRLWDARPRPGRSQPRP